MYLHIMISKIRLNFQMFERQLPEQRIILVIAG